MFLTSPVRVSFRAGDKTVISGGLSPGLNALPGDWVYLMRGDKRYPSCLGANNRTASVKAGVDSN